MENKIVVVIKGILIKEQKALIIKRADDDEIGGGTWEFSGGNLEFGENPEQTLKREFIEETGIDINVEKLLYVTSFKTHPYRQVILITYLCSCNECNVRLSPEHSDYMWADKYEVQRHIAKEIANDIESNGVWNIFYQN